MDMSFALQALAARHVVAAPARSPRTVTRSGGHRRASCSAQARGRRRVDRYAERGATRLSRALAGLAKRHADIDRAGDLVTVNARDEVLERADLAIADDKIVGVGSAPAGFAPDRVLPARSHRVAGPDQHAHAFAMALMRNYADDLSFWPWLLQRIKPLEDHLVPDDVRIGARLGIAELIRGGTTCFHDMYFEMDGVAAEVAATGMRARLCGALFDNSGKGEELLRSAVGLHERWHGKADGRVTVGLGPHSAYLCSAGYLREILREAERLDCGLHVHLAETEREVAESRERHGVTPVQQLAELGCFGRRTVAAHGIYLDAADRRLLRKGGVSVAHNPGSNLKLANGIAPVQELLDYGVNVSLGTDGAASNDNLNLSRKCTWPLCCRSGCAATRKRCPRARCCAWRRFGERAL